MTETNIYIQGCNKCGHSNVVEISEDTRTEDLVSRHSVFGCSCKSPVDHVHRVAVIAVGSDDCLWNKRTGNRIKIVGISPCNTDEVSVVEFIPDEDDCFVDERFCVIRTDHVSLYDPVVAMDEEIQAINLVVAEKRRELQALRHQLQVAETQTAETLAKLNVSNPLLKVEMVMSGKANFVAVSGWDNKTWSPVEIDKIASDHDYDHKLGKRIGRLISLNRTVEGQAKWFLNRYRDGSGSDEEIVLFETGKECFDHCLHYSIDYFQGLLNEASDSQLERNIDWINGWCDAMLKLSSDYRLTDLRVEALRKKMDLINRSIEAKKEQHKNDVAAHEKMILEIANRIADIQSDIPY